MSGGRKDGDGTPAEGNDEIGTDADIGGGEPDARLDLWLDGKLSDEERRHFEAELERDPGQREEAHSLASMLAMMKTLPTEKAPGNMLGEVQAKLRERTGGRIYAGPKLHARFPYEAVIQSLLLIGAVLIFAVASPRPPKLVPVTSGDFLVSGSGLGVAVRVLSDYGKFVNEHVGTAPNGWRHLVGEVSNARMEAFRAEISLYPSMRIETEDPTSRETTRVRVGIKP